MASLPPNPELEHVPEVAKRTQDAQEGQQTSTVHHAATGQTLEQLTATAQPDSPPGVAPGTVYVTRGIPDLLVEVLPSQHVKVPEGDDPADPDDYFEGQSLVLHGPTAHMLEARGYVKVLGVAP